MTREIDTTCAITRTAVPAMDAILGHAFPVLDHGFVRVIDYMGNDASIVQMARTSYGNGTKATSDDTGLIRYLMRHWHTSPFEGCEIKLHVKLPVFVARQWIRHRTAAVNEVSARYSILPGEFYMPEPERLGRQSKTNKQGTAVEGYDQIDEEMVFDLIDGAHGEANRAYISLNEDHDLARELSRIVLPVSTYTEWYWKIDLHNLFHFLRLRSDPHAQHEIQVYSQLIEDLVQKWVPEAYRAWVDYRRDAGTFSRMEMDALRNVIGNCLCGSDLGTNEATSFMGMTSRERSEFLAKIGCRK